MTLVLKSDLIPTHSPELALVDLAVQLWSGSNQWDCRDGPWDQKTAEGWVQCCGYHYDQVSCVPPTPEGPVSKEYVLF